jgi:hypothetical protein
MLAPVGFQIEVGRDVEPLLRDAERGDAIDPEGARIAAHVTVADQVPGAGMVNQSVRIDQAAGGARSRRGSIIDLDGDAAARSRDQLAEVGGHRALRFGDDRAGRQALGLAGVVAESAQELALGGTERVVERRDPALAQRADAEQERAALGRRQAERARQTLGQVDEDATILDRDQEVLARVAIGRADLGQEIEVLDHLIPLDIEESGQLADLDPFRLARDVRDQIEEPAQPLRYVSHRASLNGVVS